MYFHASLNLALDGGELEASQPGQLRGQHLRYPLIRSLGGPQQN